jgi:hypothetical protein
MFQGRKQFFFEKKNQKTFAPEGTVLETPGAQEQKVFAELFSKSDRFLPFIPTSACNHAA